MQIKMKSFSRGDTLIEVLFAVAVFSLVAVSALMVMNQGSAIAQRALEISIVRDEIDAQAETLRFLNSSYLATYDSRTTSYTGPAEQWRLMKDHIAKHPNILSAFGPDAKNPSKCPTPPSPSSFIINSRKAVFPKSYSIAPAKTFSQVDYTNNVVARGIWIEAVLPNINYLNQTNANYIDFHIRACWDSPGQSMPITIGTIVRLYEPRG